jgi:hypothetical protein
VGKPGLKNRLLQQAMFAGAVAAASSLGKVLFVDSTNGSDGGDGLSEQHPLLTLTRAVALADAGDTIVCAPGGSEAVTATIAVAVANLKIVCPTANPFNGFAITGAGTLALMTVSAAGCHVEGLHFARTALEATASAQHILTTNAADRLTVVRCLFDDSAIVTTYTGAGVEVVNACDDVQILDSVFLDCQFGVKFTMATGITCSRPVIRGCRFFVGQALSFGIASALTGTGAVKGLVIRDCAFLEAIGTGAPAASAWNGSDGTDATRGPIKLEAAVDQYVIDRCSAYTALATGRGFADLNAIASGALGSLVASADEKEVGTLCVVKKTLTSSAILQTGVDVTLASVGGELELVDVVLKTNGTGLAAGTNLTLETNNANGIGIFMTTAVSGLGANKTIDHANASVSKHRTVLEVGKKVTAKMTVADGTGAGTVDVYLMFTRLARGANVLAA